MLSNESRWNRRWEPLALNRTATIVLVTVLFFGLGEQLWESFMPIYLAWIIHSIIAPDEFSLNRES